MWVNESKLFDESSVLRLEEPLDEQQHNLLEKSLLKLKQSVMTKLADVMQLAEHAWPVTFQLKVTEGDQQPREAISTAEPVPISPPLLRRPQQRCTTTRISRSEYLGAGQPAADATPMERLLFGHCVKGGFIEAYTVGEQRNTKSRLCSLVVC